MRTLFTCARIWHPFPFADCGPWPMLTKFWSPCPIYYGTLRVKNSWSSRCHRKLAHILLTLWLAVWTQLPPPGVNVALANNEKIQSWYIYPNSQGWAVAVQDHPTHLLPYTYVVIFCHWILILWIISGTWRKQHRSQTWTVSSWKKSASETELPLLNAGKEN